MHIAVCDPMKSQLAKRVVLDSMLKIWNGIAQVMKEAGANIEDATGTTMASGEEVVCNQCNHPRALC
ncbi:hypothetical protein AK812_SmicGene22625 [Symbiodinium microadriaticum]|uniref:Uncharacterized protein n=1 Tax=Symbiodinium microadriaticum TaxID=2951 RepID=A0A1Q9DJA7_SYMMI|nr:hypothetical protein AK812_SmicGene22625 [Symbiodinium microadriaticum]